MRQIILLLFICSSILMGYAQNQEQSKEQSERRRAMIEEFNKKKKEFISAEVKLTTEEAEKFWPIYDEYSQKKWELHRQQRGIYRGLKEKQREGKVNDAEYKKANDALIDNAIKDAQLTKDYYTKFEKVFSAEKIYKLFDAEQRYNNELLKQVENRGRDGKDGRSQHSR